MRPWKRVFGSFLLAATTLHAETPAELDALAASHFPPNEPGAAVLVTKSGEVLLRKGYGLADVELGIPVEPDTVFRIGSVTKQFTAVAVLMLEEQGKLSVGDDVRRHLPDFPTGGRAVTLEHLLTHTSGIRSYTDMESFGKRMREDLSVAEVIASFQDEPLAFEPGEKYAYNNSGYFLLGAVIEKASGKSYAFLGETIFEPLGMTQTYYGSATRIIPRRAQGYDGRNGEFSNAEYLSMTLPYAAGALLSTVDDLAKWDEALYGSKLLSDASRAKAWRPFLLTNGSSTHYAYGWGVSIYGGRTVLSHGGGINGFLCHVLRVPEDRIFVAVLTNRNDDKTNPGNVARKLAALAMGKPIETSEPADVPRAALERHVGLYRVDEKARYLVRLENDRLRLRRYGDEHPEGGRTRDPGPNERLNRIEGTLVPISESEFALEDSLTRARFEQRALVVEDWGREERAVATDEPFDDESRILAAVETLFRGMSEREPELILSVLDRHARLVQTSIRNGRPVIRKISTDEFLSRVTDRDGPKVRETLVNPEVRVADNLASVWAPYRFHVGEKLTHCGEDSFQLVRTDVGWPGWKIVALADTRRTEGCESKAGS